MKSFTDISQSIKLQSILPIESADNHYVRQLTDFDGKAVEREWSEPKYGNPNSKYANYIIQNFTTYEVIPCWTLAALLDFLKPDIYLEHEDGVGWKVSEYVVIENPNSILSDIKCVQGFSEDNTIDACVEMVLKLHEQNLL